MAMNKKEKHDFVILGGLAGGGLLIFLLLHRPTATPMKGGRQSSPTPQQKTVTANPQQASLSQAIVQAKAQAAQAFDQSVLGAETVQAGENVAYNTNLTNKQVAFNTNAAQTTQAKISAAAAQAIASTEAAAQEQVASTQAQAQEQAYQSQASAQQSSGLFGFLGNLFGGIAPFLFGL